MEEKKKMEKAAEETIASIDFGANGKVELTQTRLLAYLKGQTTVASLTGRKTGVNEELRIKLDQLKNLGVLPRKSYFELGPSLLALYGLPLYCPLLGAVIGWMFGAVAFFFWLGFLLGIAVAIWLIRFTPKLMKSLRSPYLIFTSPDGSNVSMPFDYARTGEIEEFVKIAKKTQSAYLDSI